MNGLDMIAARLPGENKIAMHQAYVTWLSSFGWTHFVTLTFPGGTTAQVRIAMNAEDGQLSTPTSHRGTARHGLRC